jgi:VanZ family protein
MNNTTLIRGACGGAAAIMAVALFAGAEAAGQVPLFPPPFDKLAHFSYYGLMAALLAHAVGLRWLWLPLVLVPLVGAADEWHQSLTPGRDPSFWDWVADALGTVVFVHAYCRHSRRGRAASTAQSRSGAP